MTAAKGEGYFRVPDDVIRKHGRTLGTYGLAVYMALATHADRNGIAYPSRTTIAKYCDISLPTVRLYIGVLVRLKLVRIVTTGRRGRSTRYQLTAGFYEGKGKADCSIEGKQVSPNHTHKPDTTRARSPPATRPATAPSIPRDHDNYERGYDDHRDDHEIRS